jgi:hypothetical protein
MQMKASKGEENDRSERLRLSDGIYGRRNDRRIRFESWHDGLFSLVCHNIKHMVDIGICKARQNVGIMASTRFNRYSFLAQWICDSKNAT